MRGYIRQKGNHSWQIQIYTGMGPDGKRRRHLETVRGRKGDAQRRLTELQASADEVIRRLSDQARGDMGDFLDISSVSFQIDLNKAKELGLTHLIKKVKQRTTTILGKKAGDEDVEHHWINNPVTRCFNVFYSSG